MDSGSQVNAMHPTYVKKLGFKKNDRLRSQTFEDLFGSQHQNGDGLILGILFLTLGCADIRFAESLFEGLTRLWTTKRVELFNAKKLRRWP